MLKRNLSPLPVLILVILLSACASPPQTNLATPSLPSVVEVSPTATIEWFPATATPTPITAYIPENIKQPPPGIGSLTLRDDFSDLVNWANAQPSGTGGNSIILDRNRLTFAINVPPARLVSLRQDLLLANFHAEVTARLNRCLPGDLYGLYFRAANEANAYRFLLNCQGQARVERVRDGTAAPLLDWEASGDAPPGAPGEVKIGVWTAGSELRFYLNDNLQFTLLDGQLGAGTLGLYANSGGQGMNVSFSDLAVYEVAYVSPTPTATPSRTPPPSRTPRP